MQKVNLNFIIFFNDPLITFFLIYQMFIVMFNPF
jgi:hypothetical protein